MVTASKLATIQKALTPRKTRYIEPVIPLERPPKKIFNKDEVITYKLRTLPTSAESPTYDLTMPFFSTGTPEKLIFFFSDLIMNW